MNFNKFIASLIVITLLLQLAQAKPAQPRNKKALEPRVSQYVNTFIGTGGYGYGYDAFLTRLFAKPFFLPPSIASIGSNPPGAQRPFGLARVGPDTLGPFGLFLPFDHFGGYHYSDTTIRVFSHTHMVGSGVLDYGMHLPSPTKPDSSSLPFQAPLALCLSLNTPHRSMLLTMATSRHFLTLTRVPRLGTTKFI